jgi:hypothetical protein
MQNAVIVRWSLAALILSIPILSPVLTHAQSVSGSARAVQATVVTPSGLSTSTLADTGTLSGPTDARDASQPSGSVDALVTAETLHATTIGSTDQVASEASVAELTVSIEGTIVNAGFAQARATTGNKGVRSTTIHDLSINGVPTAASGARNQTIAIPGGTVVINEQTGSVVNALHIVINGKADVVIASARANVQ